MRWLKHLTSAHTDEVMVELLEKFGAKGYGIWWLILEAIAGQMDKTSDKTSITYPWRKWMNLTGIYHQSSLNLVLIFLQSRRKLVLMSDQSSPDLLTISCPNLLKYRDEYSKKSRQAPDKERKMSGVCPEQERERETDTDTDTEKRRRDLAPPPENGADPEAPPQPTGTFILLPTNKSKIEYPVTELQIEEFVELYPAVDVRQELRSMRGWSIANPSRRKTYAGMLKFVNRWLSREQDKGGNSKRDSPQTAFTKQGQHNLKVLDAYIQKRGPTCETD